MTDKIALMKEKIDVLDRAAKAYYVDGTEIITNFEYDKLYDELVALEAETGVILAGSPTQKVGYEVASELPKEEHPTRMLSLDKTKEREDLRDWLGNQEGILSWKLDGLTVVLTYKEGKLSKAVTRGNGTVGEVITANARTFVNLPVTIGYKGDLVIRGEAVISYKDFEEINEAIPDVDAKYKNPRNLCSGSVRQLDSSVTKSRRVRFYAFSLVSAELDGNMNDMIPKEVSISRMAGMEWLSSLGFDVVDFKMVRKETVVSAVEEFEVLIKENPIPSDGLVLSFDDLEYSRSLGTTAKFPRDSIAFKWRDQIAETVLQEIEWSASRTGLINPVAIFSPVELEGTTVTRASIHNISIMEELGLGIGDEIQVYKANMIIPQIADNLTRSGKVTVPEVCPVCGEKTEIRREKGVKTLFCNNPHCAAKKIKSFTHLVSRDALDVEGLSEMTIEKFIARGMIHEPADIFKLREHREEIVNMDGFGEKSYENLIAATDEAAKTTPDRLLYALGVSGIGAANAKVIAKHCKNNWNAIRNLSLDELMTIDGVGEVLAKGFRQFFDDEENKRKVEELVSLLTIDESFQDNSQRAFLGGMTFVITGSLNHYANRDQLVAVLEDAGAKVAGSVSAKTSYLINNDLTSTSGKNKKAKDLGIPIIDEDRIRGWLEAGRIS